MEVWFCVRAGRGAKDSIGSEAFLFLAAPRVQPTVLSGWRWSGEFADGGVSEQIAIICGSLPLERSRQSRLSPIVVQKHSKFDCDMATKDDGGRMREVAGRIGC